MKSKIILIGFMGSGKTTVGKALAKKLNFEFIDMDEQIERKYGMSVQELFRVKGEPFFRTEECNLSTQLQNKENIVVASGGGCVQNPEIMTNLAKNGIIVYLNYELDHIIPRIMTETHRPLFSLIDLPSFRKLFELRRPLYEKFADIIVEGRDKPISIILDEVLQQIEKKC